MTANRKDHPMSTLTATDNPYWDAVRDHVDPAGSLWRTPTVGRRMDDYRRPDGGLDVDRWYREALKRTDFVKQYAWTITDPETVAFVAEHSRGRLVDPMAGTGYWAWVLTQAGVDVAAYDLNPPAPEREDNQWHRNVAAHLTVGEANAKDSVTWSASRTLLLSWPPYGFDARPILDAYKGDRVIYMGEDKYGCCGDDGLFDAFERDWVKVAERVPVQWEGMHDVVHVYDRGAPTNPDRRCRTCGATTGLVLLHSNPLVQEWECVDGCTGGAL